VGVLAGVGAEILRFAGLGAPLLEGEVGATLADAGVDGLGRKSEEGHRGCHVELATAELIVDS
jgi:hypothetical protein